VGSHTVVLVQILEAFPDFYNYTTFNITVSPQIEVVLKEKKYQPPSFEKPITAVNVTQCPD